MTVNDRGVVLEINPILANHVPIDPDQAYKHATVQLCRPDLAAPQYSRVATHIVRQLKVVHDPNVAGNERAYHFMPSDGSPLAIPVGYRPQVAGALAMVGGLEARQALSEFYMGSVAKGQELSASKIWLRHAQSLLAPFIAQQSEYRLATTSRHREVVNENYARTLSTLGRIGLAEGDDAAGGYLADAHNRYCAGSDKSGQTRNVMYMFIHERSRQGRIGQLGRNMGRLAWSLAAATARGQLGAWRVAGRMVPFTVTKQSALRALRDHRAF